MFVGLVVFWLTESWVSCKSAELFFVYWVLDHAEFKYDHQNGVRRTVLELGTSSLFGAFGLVPRLGICITLCARVKL